MAKLLRHAVVLSTLVALAGCVSGQVVRYGEEVPPKSESYQMVVVDRANLSRPYKVIAEVQTESGALASMDATLAELKHQGRIAGGDALTDLQRLPDGFGGMTKYGAVNNPRWSAKVIVYTDGK